ncbi:lysozyme inhibitor LprI family protein [Roseicitreum antarcticum]|uniref:Uncharacterized conserved protein YecT, DUF1311 family n=1 Tax=Roseicitreum antarcticum TaxID=564137 RepID=A0A1H2ZQ51_9RHOB|nr:lysozyme inhibitor LprI family protein [Roseicitreum antarcticum]SDX19583.1 Uncharacterized conserved protein YecT, DUF1311 family [Roseicitreum antarcticum]
MTPALGISGGAVLAALLLAAPAQAQDIAFNPVLLANCVAHAGDGAECIGLAAKACMESTEGGYSTYGMNACTDAEVQWWDARLNVSYSDLMAKERARDAEAFDPDRPSGADALRDMQRAWIAFRDRSCEYAALDWFGGTGASTIYVGCLLDLTARQTLMLDLALRPM